MVIVGENNQTMKKLSILAIAAVLTASSCKKGLENQFNESLTAGKNTSTVSVKNMSEIQVPANFNWKTTESRLVTVRLKDNQDQPVASQKVWITELQGNKIGQKIATGFTNTNGEVSFEVELPTTFNELLVNTNYLAVPRNVIMPLGAKAGQIVLGGKSPAMITTLDEGYHSSLAPMGKSGNKFNVVPGSRTWNGSGVPNYLESTNDVISSGTLSQIASTLPSGVALSNSSPLLDPTKTRVIRLVDSCEVFVTFVSEGAGYLNSLFYYTYNVSNPPASLNDITHYSVVFPNTSFAGSGGNLVSGNKVRLGNFPAGTVIGYGLAADGWKGGSQGFNGVTEGNWLVFGDRNLNPESNPAQKEHMILMNDVANHRVIMGFEDIRRDNGGCDHDFNDALFYTTANPYTAIDDDSIPTMPGSCTDTDADGVCDQDDCEPNNANVASCNTYGTGTLAFEDQWPSQGDYDMNDVVISYNYTVKTNAANVVTRVEATYSLKATGGSYLNGFGVQFPVDRSKVTNVSGATLEAGQSKAVLIPFTNMRSEMQMWNTVPGQGTSAVRNYTVSFDITNGPTLAAFGLSYYNPFIWNGTPGFGRGYEIHLPGKLPTDLANANLFGTNRDASNVNTGDTYVSKNGRYPWALNIPSSFNYPKEKADINTAHLKFATWVSSGGAQFTDWYTNGSGYRNNSNIY
jgi:LruC domain-containing protein